MKKYKVILVDPPWKQQAGRKLQGYNSGTFSGSESKNSQSLPYPTLNLQQLKRLNLSSIAHDDCHLFLWVTNKYMNQFNELLESWGFKYSTVLTWSKNPMGGGLGGTFGITSEHLIYARKGKPKFLKRMTGTVHHLKRPYFNGKPKHSAKPEFYMEMIETHFEGPFIEVFSREKRNGWDAYGNEVESDVVIGYK